ncbi:MAG: hypothetical protein V4550_18250 [Gemmatimonadota bacterium]
MTDKTIVVTSATVDSDYSFPLPLTCLLWRELIGFEPVVYLVGEPSMWYSGAPNVCYEALNKHRFECRFVPRIDAYSDGTVAKHVREHAAIDVSIPADTWIMPADADLWPLKREFYHQHEGAKEKAVLYYSNGDNFRSKEETLAMFFSGHRFPTIALCHATMRAAEWRDTFDLLPATSLVDNLLLTFIQARVNEARYVPDGETKAAWEWWVNSDQRVLTWCLALQPWFHNKGQGADVRYIERSKRRGPPDDRLDRAFPADWMTFAMQMATDAHIFKNPEHPQHWKALSKLFKLKLPHHAEWAEAYHKDYVSAGQ